MRTRQRTQTFLVSCFGAALFLAWAVPVQAGYDDAVKSLNPAAYWRLGDTGTGDGNRATDEMGSHHGTYLGGVTLGRPGAVVDGDTAAHFDEIDDYVEIPDFEYTSADFEFSVGLWFKQDELEGPDFQYMFSHDTFDSPESLNIYFREDDRDGPGEIRTHLNNINISQLPAGYADGEWHFYTLSASNTDGAQIYMDGEWVAENLDVTTDPAFVYDPPTEINLGRRIDAHATRYFGGDDDDQGLLDEVMVFDYPLSSDEVAELYEARLLEGETRLQPGDSDQDLDFDQLDLVQVQIAAKYLTGQPATWGEGDWDGAPGGKPGDPPPGNGQFDQLDIIAALAGGKYLTGPYAAIKQGGIGGDGQTSVVYDANTGEMAVDAPAGMELTSINIDSATGIFTGDPAQNLGGSFDNDADTNIFKATFGSSFGSLSFGNVAQAGLSKEFLVGDLTVVGSLAGGGDLGSVDLIYVPESSTMALLVLGLAGTLAMRRRRSS